MNNWKSTTISESYDFTSKPRKTLLNCDGKIPFIRMEDIPLSKIYANKYVLKNIKDISSATYFENGDLLLAKITPSFENGKQGIAQINYDFGYATTEVIPIKAKEGLSDIHFLFYYLKEKAVRSELAGKMEGSTGRQRLNKDLIRNLVIPIPPLSIQRNIVNVLNIVQKSIEEQEKVIETTTKLKYSLMKKIFTKGLHGEALKETAIGLIPQDWKLVQFENIAAFKNGINFSKQQKGQVGIPTIDVLNMYSKSISVDLSNLYRVSKMVKDNSDYVLKDGDLLFVRSSLKPEGVGWVSLFKDSFEPTTFCGFIINARINDKLRYLPTFYAYYFRSDNARKEFLGTDRVSITNVNQGLLKSLILPVPSIEEQREIINVLTTIDKNLETHNLLKNKYQELFISMLNLLMSGELELDEINLN